MVLRSKGTQPHPLHVEQLGAAEVMDERRAGKRLIILITGRIKINAPPSEGEAVVPPITVVIAEEWILLELLAAGEGAAEPITFEC